MKKMKDIQPTRCTKRPGKGPQAKAEQYDKTGKHGGMQPGTPPRRKKPKSRVVAKREFPQRGGEVIRP